MWGGGGGGGKDENRELRKDERSKRGSVGVRGRERERG